MFLNTEDAIPPEVVPILQWLTKKALSETITSRVKEDDDSDATAVLKILDVGCGTGALFPFYLNAAN